MRHPLLKVLLLSSALTLPVASAQAGTAAATARVTARADEAASAAKGETKTKTETKATPKSAKTADAAKTQGNANSKTGTAKVSENEKPSAKSKASAKTKTAEKDETDSKKGKTAQSGKPSGKSKPTQTADAEAKKSTASKTAKKTDTVKNDEKVTATASAKGTPYVIPDKGDKYDSRTSGTLSAPAKTVAKTPAPKPADKTVAQTTPTPKPRPATPPATTAASALTTDAGKAVDDLFGARIKVDGQPVPHNPTPTSVASSETVKPAPKTEDKLDLPTAPIPYQATVKPETAPVPKADLNATLTAEKVEPRTVSPPTPDKAAEVVAATSLPVTPSPTPADAPTLSVPEAVRQPVEAPTAPRNLAAVTVDAYARDYEGQKTGAEMRYDSSIRSGLLARQSRAGDLEGNWLVSSLTGDKLVSLALRGGGAQVDGAWRSLQGGVGLNRSGLIESAMQADDRLTLDYQSGSSRGRYRLDLRREPDGRWRGQMIDPAGTATPVVMQAQ
ncbi:MAG: hypothetical protein LDL37_02960 [Asticcacaulis sp.]|uniref:hypothetical protein n=1 Tax=Asticcacaulis sp. TaxID=1872648 RepID=UPI0025BCAE77|nr:hypothetical protein [Asticcacaulis sp.]MCA1934385.1 hypothetical protein [Asticcacaulis sp.]